MKWFGRCVAATLLILTGSSGLAWAQLDPVVCVPKGSFDPPPGAPTPTLAGRVNGARVYEGATPPALDPDRPVLVFVHGLHGAAASWASTEYYGHNDIYDAAYAAGYKSFFVDLLDTLGPAPDSFSNGLHLRDQIEAIAAHWGVDRFNLIAHSKGGVDSNVAALISTSVDTVVTLGGAHGGSPLADLAQTDWLEWLAELLGANDAGTKFLQTGCMAQFREVADSQPGNDSISFYTAAGTGWGPFLSPLSFGGLYLSGACPGGGANDGLVCVEHAKHPLARDAQGAQTGAHRLVWDQSGSFELDHDNIRVGNAFLNFIEIPFVESRDCYVPVFGSLEPYFGVFHHADATSSDVANAASGPNSLRRGIGRSVSQLIRGGPVSGSGTVEAFPVEDGATEVKIAVLVAHAGTRGRLVAPDGTVHALPRVRPAGNEILPGAHATALRILAPAAGTWRLELTGAGAFALLADIDSPLRVTLAAPRGEVLSPGTPFRFRLGTSASAAEVRARIRRISSVGAARALGSQTRAGAGEHALSLADPGVYSIAMTVTGRTAAGSAFERSAAFSVALDGTSPVPLPDVCK